MSISLLLPSRLAKILDEVKKALAKTNKNYGLVLTGIYKYFNKTDVKPSILDGGYEIILANWPSFKRIVCTTNNNIPIEILSHPYVLLNRMVLCNCIIETENNFLLESVAACDPASTDADLKMYFEASTAFLKYFDDLIDTLKSPDLQNITMQEHVLPISLEPLKI